MLRSRTRQLREEFRDGFLAKARSFPFGSRRAARTLAEWLTSLSLESRRSAPDIDLFQRAGPFENPPGSIGALPQRQLAAPCQFGALGPPPCFVGITIRIVSQQPCAPLGSSRAFRSISTPDAPWDRPPCHDRRAMVRQGKRRTVHAQHRRAQHHGIRRTSPSTSARMIRCPPIECPIRRADRGILCATSSTYAQGRPSRSRNPRYARLRRRCLVGPNRLGRASRPQ